MSVIFYHAGFSYFPGGFVGVDVFFVISGYLITTIIVKELNNDNFSILKFYERRAKRILPVLISVVTFTLVVCWFFLLPNDYELFGRSVISVAFFFSNIFFYKNVDYFNDPAEGHPLIHTWSLAVEEQFYLIFPVFLLLVWRKYSKYSICALIVLLVISLILSEYQVRTNASASFYLIHTRLWELLIGSVVAIAHVNEFRHQPLSRIITEIVPLLGLVMILIAVLAYGDSVRFPGLSALLPTIGVALILAIRKKNIIGYILSAKPVVFIGLISYSAYLWHQPLLVLDSIVEKRYGYEIPISLVLLVTLTISCLSWKFIENPIRDGRASRKVVLNTSLSVLILVGLIGFFIKESDGAAFRLDSETYSFLDEYANYPFNHIYDRGRCYLPTGKTSDDYNAECVRVNSVGSRKVLMLGDSFAAHYYHGLNEAAEKLEVDFEHLTAPACSILQGKNTIIQCSEINKFRMNALKIIKPDILIISGAWYRYVDEETKSYFFEEFAQLLVDIEKIGIDRNRIFVVGNSPLWKPTLPEFILSRYPAISRNDQKMLPNPYLADLAFSEAVVTSATKRLDVKFISALDALCNQSECLAVVQHDDKSELIVWDDGHFTKTGSIVATKQVFGELLTSLRVAN